MNIDRDLQSIQEVRDLVAKAKEAEKILCTSPQEKLDAICASIACACMDHAEELAKKFGIPFQETVRRGGSTNAGKISLTAKAVPVLVLGVPSRYVHTHYNFCAKSDLEAAADLAVEVIRGLDAEKIRHICRQDILK